MWGCFTSYFIDILCGISKASPQNILTIHWKINLLYTMLKICELSDSRACMRFETPPGVVYVHQCSGSPVIQIVAYWIMTNWTHKNQCLWNLINQAFALKVSSVNWRSFHCGRNALKWHQYITDMQSRRPVYINGIYYMFRCVSGNFKRWRRTLFMWKVYGDSKALVG